MNKPENLIVHHTADYYIGEQFSRINAWHKQRDFPISSKGFFVGYHYVIERSGQLIQAREDTETGAHTIGMNNNSIGICVVGDFNQERPSLAQLIALKNLINKKMIEHNILPDNIRAHRNFKDTSCCGKNLTDLEIKLLFKPDMAYFEKIVLRLEELIKQILASRPVAGKGQKYK